MARGGRGGRRGGGRGKGGLGIPGAQNNRTSLAQSAGKVSTFQGTSGGGAFGNKSGGSKGTKKIGRTTLANSTSATIRSPGGDQTTVHGGLSGARVGPNLAAAQGTRRDTKILPHLRKGAQRGRGGSTQ
jgi:hypothetical protein